MLCKTEEDKKIAQQFGRALLEQQEIVYLNLKDKANGQQLKNKRHRCK